ncbi:Uncharacterised protein [Klebsiella pneumoniae]|nr:Uncharacterised protein [Klebsiella pneumoniae]SYK81772.1 Uncharacterised protein [Klebsiella pneumoniae]SYV02940.1 Uncharacterised protein [Klebsiella pneumoniae]SYV18397.1 Uncharacterised protein [Klebsiella pneumoniae]SYV24751.1 Uncharacterised protein [Klebsiella pneumoniae]
MMSLWDALRMNMMISYQELVRTFLRFVLAGGKYLCFIINENHTIFLFSQWWAYYIRASWPICCKRFSVEYHICAAFSEKSWR